MAASKTQKISAARKKLLKLAALKKSSSGSKSLSATKSKGSKKSPDGKPAAARNRSPSPVPKKKGRPPKKLCDKTLSGEEEDGSGSEGEGDGGRRKKKKTENERLRARLREYEKKHYDSEDSDDICEIPKPPGQSGRRDPDRGYILQDTMELNTVEGNIEYNGILDDVHDGVSAARMDKSVTYKKQPAIKIAKVVRYVGKRRRYMTPKRFPADWATHEMLKNYLQNIRRKLKTKEKKKAALAEDTGQRRLGKTRKHKGSKGSKGTRGNSSDEDAQPRPARSTGKKQLKRLRRHSGDTPPGPANSSGDDNPEPAPKKARASKPVTFPPAKKRRSTHPLPPPSDSEGEDEPVSSQKPPPSKKSSGVRSPNRSPSSRAKTGKSSSMSGNDKNVSGSQSLAAALFSDSDTDNTPAQKPGPLVDLTNLTSLSQPTKKGTFTGPVLSSSESGSASDDSDNWVPDNNSQVPGDLANGCRTLRSSTHKLA
ncbi:hypothetical protein FA13DRAFT_1799532 [Coprinellus micaceus]|uniref:Uncharacterized protein n=1 Tax=Coprinellus micaceus TaxID=71717 RepID=A0A4Y7SIQ9_COPMI|nr:hypothetical protein FA13DRAFT_1799532 [Coprinellus micaceus]